MGCVLSAEGPTVGEARPLYKTDELARCREQCKRYKTALAHERTLRKAAEKNAAEFHALMLHARVQLIRLQKGAA